LVSGGF